MPGVVLGFPGEYGALYQIFRPVLLRRIARVLLVRGRSRTMAQHFLQSLGNDYPPQIFLDILNDPHGNCYCLDRRMVILVNDMMVSHMPRATDSVCFFRGDRESLIYPWPTKHAILRDAHLPESHRCIQEISILEGSTGTRPSSCTSTSASSATAPTSPSAGSLATSKRTTVMISQTNSKGSAA